MIELGETETALDAKLKLKGSLEELLEGVSDSSGVLPNDMSNVCIASVAGVLAEMLPKMSKSKAAPAATMSFGSNICMNSFVSSLKLRLGEGAKWLSGLFNIEFSTTNCVKAASAS